MYQLTTEQAAFIHAYGKAVASCPNGLIYKFFENRDKFQDQYSDTGWPSSVGDAWEIWLYAKEWANKPQESNYLDSMLGNPMQVLNNLSIR
jgi:hypothetical protein